MRDFFDNYVAAPLGILLFLFIAPTVIVGGFTLALHLAGHLPEMGICQKVEE